MSGSGVQKGFRSEMLFEWVDERMGKVLRVVTEAGCTEMWTLEVTQDFFCLFIHKALIESLWFPRNYTKLWIYKDALDMVLAF